MTDDKVKADVQFISAALSWYDGTEAAADVREAWARLQAERDKLSAEVESLTADAIQSQMDRDAAWAEKLSAAEAKLTALVEAIDLEIKSQRNYKNMAEHNGSYAGSSEARSKIELLERLRALAHHSAPVGEQSA